MVVYKYVSFYADDIHAFTPLGCFRGGKHQRLKDITVFLISIKIKRNYQKWSTDPKDYADMVNICAAMAERRNYPIFGLEYAGECWGADEFDVTIDPESDTCFHGIGIYGYEVFWYRFN